MSTPEEIWTARLHAAVDDHPGALSFDVAAYVAAGRKRARRNRAVALAATVAAVAVVAVGAAIGTRGTPEPAPAVPPIPAPAKAPNGWVALDVYQGEHRGGAIYLVRPGQDPRRLEVAGPADTDDACPAWSPDGTRLMFGRVPGPSHASSGEAELVIVPVDQNGATSKPTIIELDGFDAGDGFAPHPCATWAPDGRWVAFAGADEVWVVDTQTRAIRRLPDLRPSDLEWRPGTDELAIAGYIRPDRAAATVSSPVTMYSVSTGESRPLGSVHAAQITWSPDGTTLAYTPGDDGPDELWLVDADGTNERLLTDDLATAAFPGVGPVWSPAGDRIAYQRSIYWPSAGFSERAEVGLVSVADGSQTGIKPPKPPDPKPLRKHTAWWPRWVTWSPDGTTLLYSAWCNLEPRRLGGDGHATIAVPVDAPQNAAVVTDLSGQAGQYSRAAVQTWGRR